MKVFRWLNFCELWHWPLILAALCSVMPAPASGHWRHSVVRQSMRASMHDHILEVCERDVLQKMLAEISPSLHLRCSGGQRRRQVRFWGQKVKDQGHCKTEYGQMSTLGGIFLPASGICGCILMKHIAFTHYQVHVMLMTFWRSWVQISRSFWCRHSDWWFAIKDRLVVDKKIGFNSKTAGHILIKFHVVMLLAPKLNETGLIWFRPLTL